jgi:hypothetical protein
LSQTFIIKAAVSPRRKDAKEVEKAMTARRDDRNCEKALIIISAVGQKDLVQKNRG